MSEIPVWLRDEVIRGLQKLLVLRLDGVPGEDLVQATAAAWIEAVWSAGTWHRERDTPRLRAAFLALSRETRRWPPPRAALDYLPPMPSTLALPSPPDEEGRQRLLAMCGEVLAGIEAKAAAERSAKRRERVEDLHKRLSLVEKLGGHEGEEYAAVLRRELERIGGDDGR